MTLPYTAAVQQGIGPGDTAVVLVYSDVEMTLLAAPVVLQRIAMGGHFPSS